MPYRENYRPEGLCSLEPRAPRSHNLELEAGYPLLFLFELSKNHGVFPRELLLVKLARLERHHYQQRLACEGDGRRWVSTGRAGLALGWRLAPVFCASRYFSFASPLRSGMTRTSASHTCSHSRADVARELAALAGAGAPATSSRTGSSS